MKKSKLLVLSLLAVSALGLTSCGSQGPKGEKGEPGIQGKQGEPGKDGKDGAPGKDGKDGVNGKDGKDGAPGKDGKDGSNGKTNIEVAVDRLNSMLKTNTTKLTPYERFSEAGITEFNFKNLANFNNEFYYSLQDNKFIAVDLTNYILTGSTNYAKNSVLPEESNDLFKFSYSLTDISTSYANYLCDFDVKPSDLSIKIQTSLDVGANNEAFKLNYLNHSGVAKEVVIRTNGGALTVNAPLDTVKHYGNADNVNIVAVASASYHENGTVPFIQISRGRIEIEATGDVNGIHVANVQTVGENGEITKTENTFSHDVVLSLNGADVNLTRDTIGTEIATPILVCEVQANANSDEYIWLVGDGTIENAKVYVTETNAAPDTSVASTTTTENASAAAIAIANNAVNTGSEENPAYTAVDTGVKLNISEDQEIWATYDSQVKLEYLINKTSFVNLKQTANITEMTEVVIPEGREVVIDMNGYTIDAALKSEGRHYYALYNYGTLTLQDSSEDGTSYIKARGIENLGGKMTINSGTYYNIDTNGGAAVWNESRTSNSDSKYYVLETDVDYAKNHDQNYYDTDLGVSISNGTYTQVETLPANAVHVSMDFNSSKTISVPLYKVLDVTSVGEVVINGGNFYVEHTGSSSDNGGPGVVNSQLKTKLTINGGRFKTKSNRTYAIISSGELLINNAEVISQGHGALAVNAGSAVVNGGTFSAVNYYGIYVAGEYGAVLCEVNGGTFSSVNQVAAHIGNKNRNGDGGIGARASVIINNGTFNGASNKGAINVAFSADDFGVGKAFIYGGTFSSQVDSEYIMPGFTCTQNDNNTWIIK